jgi:hypothetical protein
MLIESIIFVHLFGIGEFTRPSHPRNILWPQFL